VPPVPSLCERSRPARHALTSIVTIAVILASWGCAPSSGDGPVRGPLSGTFNYTKTEGAFLLGGTGQYEVLVPQTREIWIGHDGSGRLRTTFGSPLFFGEHDRAEWQDPPEWLQERTQDETSLRDFSYIDVSSLPTDPNTLLEHIHSGLDPTDVGAGPAPWEMFIAAHGILWETVPPLELSMAVLAMLSENPDIEVKEGDADLVGRTATRFSITSPDGQFRTVMWLDAETGILLGEQQELLMATPTIDAEPPVVIKQATYAVSEVVDSTIDR
jgi:hypothetical protein